LLRWRWLACYSWSELLSFPIKAAPSCSQPLISPRVTKSPCNRWSCLHRTCSAKIAESKYLCHFHTAISTVSHPICKSHRNRGRWMRIRHLALPHWKNSRILASFGHRQTLGPTLDGLVSATRSSLHFWWWCGIPVDIGDVFWPRLRGSYERA
jgi:hypothetical protein